ncbi:hypothetical protein ABI59_18900 [Acidobacteria bacterium Mor1]|nr:hypothetical protein ABI59_18900 [Acidobacteria bacterium Mor1]
MRDLLLLGIIFGMLPLSFTRPWIGVIVTVWLGLMNPHRLCYGMAYSFPVVKLATAVTVLGFLFTSDKYKIPRVRETYLLLLLFAYYTFTTQFAQYPADAKEEWVHVAKIYVMVFLILSLFQDRVRMRWLLLIMALSIAFYGVKGGIFSILTGGNHLIWGPPKSIIAGNNELALAELMIFPILFYMGIKESRRNKWAAYGIFAATFLTIVAVVFSYSRGAFLSLIAMAGMFVWRSNRRFTFIIIALIAGLVLFQFIPDKWFDRMNTIETAAEEDKSAMGRINAWWYAYNVASERPFTGAGFQSFTEEMFLDYAPDPYDYHDAHSVYFEVMGEHGFVGWGIFMSLLGFSYLSMGKLRRISKPHPELVWVHENATMLQLSLVVYGIGGAFLGMAYFDLYYFLVASVIIMKDLGHKEVAKIEEAAAAERKAKRKAAEEAKRRPRLVPPPGEPLPEPSAS